MPGAWRKTKATQFGWAGFSAAVFRAMDCGCNRISLSLKSVGRFDVFVACEVWQWERRHFFASFSLPACFYKTQAKSKNTTKFHYSIRSELFHDIWAFSTTPCQQKTKKRQNASWKSELPATASTPTNDYDLDQRKLCGCVVMSLNFIKIRCHFGGPLASGISVGLSDIKPTSTKRQLSSKPYCPYSVQLNDISFA